MHSADQDTPIEELLNCGEKVAQWLDEVGVKTIGDLKEVGVIETYKRVKALKKHPVNIILLYALVGGLEDLGWNELPEDLKNHLQEQVMERQS